MKIVALLFAATLIGMIIELTLGVRGLVGLVLGISAAALNLVGLWYAIKTFTSVALPEDFSKRGALIIVLACFVKMPVFVLAGVFTWRIGMPAPITFLVGVGLVYSGLVWRAQTVR